MIELQYDFYAHYKLPYFPFHLINFTYRTPWMGELPFQNLNFISLVFTTYNISKAQNIGSYRHLIYINKDICIYVNILRKHRMFLYSCNLAMHNEIYLSIIFLTSNVSVQISILYLFDFSIFSKKGELLFWIRVLQ